MRGTNLDVEPLAFSSASLAWRRVVLLTLTIRLLQPLLSLLLSTTFNRLPTTGCSPTNWALSGHEPDCQSCNISGTFLQIQSDIFFEHERKIISPCTTWFLKMKQDSLSFCQSNGPILWQSKILPYYLIPTGCRQVAAKNHIQTIKLHQKFIVFNHFPQRQHSKRSLTSH